MRLPRFLRLPAASACLFLLVWAGQMLADEIPEADWGGFVMPFDPWADARPGEWCRYNYRVNEGRLVVLTSEVVAREADTLSVEERRRGGLPAYSEKQVVPQVLNLATICESLRSNGLQVRVLGASLSADTLDVAGTSIPCTAFFTHLEVIDPERKLENELKQTQWLSNHVPGSGVVRVVKEQIGRLGARSIETRLEMELVEWGVGDP